MIIWIAVNSFFIHQVHIKNIIIKRQTKRPVLNIFKKSIMYIKNWVYNLNIMNKDNNKNRIINSYSNYKDHYFLITIKKNQNQVCYKKLICHKFEISHSFNWTLIAVFTIKDIKNHWKNSHFWQTISKN